MGKKLSEDRNALILDHMEHVRILARRMYGQGALSEDLEAAGLLGLVQAADAFSEAHAARFWTFAIHRVIGAMQDFLRAHASTIRTPRGQEHLKIGSMNAIQEKNERFDLEDKTALQPEDDMRERRLRIAMQAMRDCFQHGRMG